MDTHARPLEIDDGPALAAIDRAYAAAFGLEPRTGPASLRFFARSGHAFVAVGAGGVCGFALAQPLFDGERATVLVQRMATDPLGDAEALRALARALTKSAYDAGVYDLRVDLPSGDREAAAALAAEGFQVVTATVHARYLGSRASTVAAARAAGGNGGDHG